MNARRWSRWGVSVGALVLLLWAMPARAQEITPPIAPGQEIEGEIRTRFGDLWTLALCAGDIVTVEASSDAFTPFIDWYVPGNDEPAASAEGDGGEARLETDALEASGVYTIGVTGERRTDRGAYLLSVTLDGAPNIDEPDGYLAPGQPVTDSVRTRFGDLWQIHACAGESFTVTMRSAVYDPYLELLSPDDEEPLAEAEGSDGEAVLTVEPQETTKTFLLNAGGTERTDRGAYTITLLTASLDTLATSMPTPAPTAPPPPTRAPTRTPTPPAQAVCMVLVDQLNLRAGPGTHYGRLAQLAPGTALRPLGRDAASDWIEVTVTGSAQRGWVLAIPNYVSCSLATGTLPIVRAPPTPTLLPTATATQTPVATRTPTATPTFPAPLLPPATPTQPATATPTLPALAVLPAPSNGVLPGNLYTGPGMASNIDFDNGITTFRERFYLRMEPGETDRRVDHVTFTVYDLESTRSDPVHEQREGTYGYCLFGGGEPVCNALELTEGARWPSSGELVYRSSYNVVVNIYLEGDSEDNPTGQWFGSIVLDSSRLPSREESSFDPLPLEAELRESGPGNLDSTLFGQISFGVYAWDPTIGNNDGDGIREVFLRIYDPNGALVYERREGTEGWCAFSGGEPECVVHDYAAAGYLWPNGASVTPGVHTLSAEVVADDDRRTTREWTVDIQ